MSTQHITLTAADLRMTNTSHELEPGEGDDRSLVIHLPTVRGINLTVFATYYFDNGLPSELIGAGAPYKGVVTLGIPQHCNRVTLTTPQLPRFAEIIEVEHPGSFTTNSRYDRRNPTVTPARIPFPIDHDGNTVEISEQPLEGGLDSRIERARSSCSTAPTQARNIQSVVEEIKRRRSKAEWKSLALARGHHIAQQVEDLRHAVTAHDEMRARAKELGTAARVAYRNNCKLIDDLNLEARGNRIAELERMNRQQADTIFRQGKELKYLKRELNNALPSIKGEKDLVRRAERLAEWCSELEDLKRALVASDEMLEQTRVELEAKHSTNCDLLMERRKLVGQLSAAADLEARDARRITELEQELARLNQNPAIWVGIDPAAPHRNAPSSVYPYGIVSRPRQNGKTFPAEGVWIAPPSFLQEAQRQTARANDDAILAAAGITRKTHDRTVRNLRRARHELREVRSLMRESSGNLGRIRKALNDAGL